MRRGEGKDKENFELNINGDLRGISSEEIQFILFKWIHSLKKKN